jgi:hypothetical protein
MDLVPMIDVRDLVVEYATGRAWAVLGVHLGALGQESVIELEPLGRTAPNVHGKRDGVHVPVDLLTAGVRQGAFALFRGWHTKVTGASGPPFPAVPDITIGSSPLPGAATSGANVLLTKGTSRG